MAREAECFSARQEDTDFVFRLKSDAYEVVCVPRHRGRTKPINTLAGGDERRYDENFSTFGVLEMTGYVVGIKTYEGFRILTQTPSLYEKSLCELSR